MIVYHSLNVTISSLTLKLKFLVVVKSRVISLCHYLNFVLCISRLCVSSLKLQFGMIIVFKWESKPALKIQLILFFLLRQYAVLGRVCLCTVFSRSA